MITSCHCVTCADEGVEMTVAALDPDREMVLCVDQTGVRHTVEAALVGPLDLGDLVLVHAGVALVCLSEARA